MIRKTVLKGSLVTLVALSMSACSVQTGDVSAKAGRTESTQVAEYVLPFDAKKPKVAIIVEPFIANANVTTWTRGEAGAVPIGDKMAAQLITSLSKVGNFMIYDNRAAKKVATPKGGKGPYIVKATLTELTENAEASAESNGASLGGIGLLTGIAGAVTGNRALGWSGFGLAAANPSYRKDHQKRTGVVAFDVQIMERSTGRIVSSFEASGNFTSESAAAGMSIFGIGGAKAVAAQSALGQALRAAMNTAAEKSAEALL